MSVFSKWFSPQPNKIYRFNLEIPIILSLGFISLWLSLGGVLPNPWVAVWLTVLSTWLLPGYLLWRLFGARGPQPWFYGLPLSFGLGLAWLMLPATILFLFESNLDRFVIIATGLNIILLLFYIGLLFIKRSNEVIVAERERDTTRPNGWLLGSVVVMLVILLAVFFNTIGFTGGGDEWSAMQEIRAFLDGESRPIAIQMDHLWNFLIAFVVRLSGTDLLNVYRIYLPVLFIIVASFAYLVLADTLFDDQNIVYFAFIIQGLYFLSDIHTDGNGVGLGFLARLLEDKYVAWLLVLPVAQTFFLKYIKSGQVRFLFLFGLMAIVDVLIHPIALTWLFLSTGAVGLPLLWYRQDRPVMIFYGISAVLFSFGLAFAWWVRSGKPIAYFTPSEPASDSLITLSAKRVLFFSPESYMAHPFLFSHPLVIISLVLSLGLLFLGFRRSLAAQFLFSNTLVVLLLLFNPFTASFIGQFVGFWQIYRITWMLPISLTIGYVLYKLIRTFHQFVFPRLDIFSRRDPPLIKLLPLLLLILAIPLMGRFATSWRSLQVWNGTVITKSERDLMSHIQQKREPYKIILAPYQLSVHLPVMVGQVRVVIDRKDSIENSRRLAESRHFYESQIVDQTMVDWLRKHNVSYVIIPLDSPLEIQLRSLSTIFDRLYANTDYAFYAWRPGQIDAIEAAIIRGNTQRLAGQLDQAEITYQQVHQEAPKHLLGILGLGAVYETQFDFEQALTLYQQSLQDIPDNPWLQVALANVQFISAGVENSGEIDQTLVLLLEALAIEPFEASIYRQVLNIYENLAPPFRQTTAGQMIEASLVDFYQTRAEGEPYFYDYQQVLAEIYKKLGYWEQALVHYELMAKRFPGRSGPYLLQANLFIERNNLDKAIESYKEAISKQSTPGSIDPYLGLSRLYRQQKDYDLALEYVEQAKQFEYNNEQLTTAIHLEWGYIHVEQQKNKKALQHFLEAVELSPDNAAVHTALGNVYQQQKDFKQAISHYRQAIELAPNSPWNHIFLGALLLEMGQQLEGAAELKQAIVLDPKSSTIFQRVGALIAQHQSPVEALPYFEQSVNLDPTNSYGYLGLARFYRQSGDFSAALDYARKALNVAQDSDSQGSAHLELGQIYIDQGDRLNAENHFLQAIETLPTNPWVYATAGRFYQKQGDLNQAIDYYRRATNLTPSLTQHYILLSTLLFETKHHPEAEEILQQALIADPESDTIYRQVKQLIEKYYSPDLVSSFQEMVVTQEPQNPGLYLAVGRLLADFQNWGEAVSLYEEAVDRDGANAEIYLALGDAYSEVSATDKGLTSYQRAASALLNQPPGTLHTVIIASDIADRLWHYGDQDTAVSLLEKHVANQEYNNFYAHWRLAQHYDRETSEGVEADYEIAVRFFALKDIEIAPEPELRPYQAQAFLGAVADGFWTRETLHNVLIYLLHNEQFPAVENLFQALLQEAPDDPDLHFYRGELYYHQGEWRQAAVAYQQVLTQDPNYALAYWRLGQLSQMAYDLGLSGGEQWLQEAARLYEYYYELAPDDLLGLQKLVEITSMLKSPEADQWLAKIEKAEPTVTVEQELENGWTFLGYRTNEKRLVRGERVPLWLYWQGPNGVVPGDEAGGWTHLGEERWMQLKEATNLITNGNFELGRVETSPTGFPDTLHQTEEATRQLRMHPHNGQPSIVALLENSSSYTRTSFVSSPLAIEDNKLYLQTGWISSLDGNAYLGHRWFGDISDKGNYSHAAARVRSAEWNRYAAIAQPLPGAEQVQVWLLNSNSTGRAYFDDVTFIEIDNPGK